MAKRYARLNWQNKPSVATPINATNLNKMDKGIDDCDNAIEEIYAKRVNNVVTTNTDTFLAGPVGKLLQDQITTINNNFAYQNEVVSNSYGLAIEVNKKGVAQLKITGTLSTQIATSGATIGTATNKPIYAIRDFIVTRSGIGVRVNIETSGSINLYPEANLPVGTTFNNTVTYLS